MGPWFDLSNRSSGLTMLLFPEATNKINRFLFEYLGIAQVFFNSVIIVRECCAFNWKKFIRHQCMSSNFPLYIHYMVISSYKN